MMMKMMMGTPAAKKLKPIPIRIRETKAIVNLKKSLILTRVPN